MFGRSCPTFNIISLKESYKASIMNSYLTCKYLFYMLIWQQELFLVPLLSYNVHVFIITDQDWIIFKQIKIEKFYQIDFSYFIMLSKLTYKNMVSIFRAFCLQKEISINLIYPWTLCHKQRSRLIVYMVTFSHASSILWLLDQYGLMDQDNTQKQGVMVAVIAW